MMFRNESLRAVLILQLLILTRTATDPQYGWMEIDAQGDASNGMTDFLNFPLPDYILQIKHTTNLTDKRGCIHLYGESGASSSIGMFMWTMNEMSTDVINIDFSLTNHNMCDKDGNYSFYPGLLTSDEKTWSLYLDKDGVRLGYNLEGSAEEMEVFSHRYSAKCKTAISSLEIKQIKIQYLDKQHYRAKQLGFSCNDTVTTAHTIATVSCTLTGGTKALSSIEFKWRYPNYTEIVNSQHNYTTTMGQTENFQREISLKIPAAENKGGGVYILYIKWAGNDDTWLFKEAKLLGPEK